MDGAPVLVHGGGDVFSSLFLLEEVAVDVHVALGEIEEEAEHVSALQGLVVRHCMGMGWAYLTFVQK